MMFKNLAIEDYLKGMSYRMVGEKYKVNHKTVRYWVIKSGNESRSRVESLILFGKKMRGVRRSVDTEFKKGEAPWNKNTKGVMKLNKTSFKEGYHYSKKTEFKKGKDHPCYIDGTSSPYPSIFNDKLKHKIRKRDHYICQNCGIAEKEQLIIYGKKLEIHHIDYSKDNCEEVNLISLCRACHAKTNFNREYWKTVFKEKIHV